MDSRLLEVALGLAVTFAIVAAMSAVITELIARFLGLRARFLLLGIRELLDGADVTTVTVGGGAAPEAEVSATARVLATPVMKSQGMAGSLADRTITMSKPQNQRLASMKTDSGRRALPKTLRGLPSYIPARTFATGVLSVVVPDRSGRTSISELRDKVAALQGCDPLKDQLQCLLLGVEGDIGAFRTAVEGWYDDHMARVSGWYKRHVAKWSLAIGAVLVLLLNVNAVTIARTLYVDDAARAAIVAAAASAAACEADEEPDACLAELYEQLSTVRAAGLPMGWPVVAECAAPGADCDFWQQRGVVRLGDDWLDWQPVLSVVGLALTVLALVPGARFWFDLLGRLGSLRTTGPRPASTTTDG